MQARDVMTTDVVTVQPETPIRQIAALLLEKRISAVPVVDATGAVVGMVSEGDLIRFTLPRMFAATGGLSCWRKASA